MAKWCSPLKVSLGQLILVHVSKICNGRQFSHYNLYCRFDFLKQHPKPFQKDIAHFTSNYVSDWQF